jgi:hypothetical protein
MYQSLNVMGGGDVVQGRRFHGHYASFNLKDHREIVHINIEKATRRAAARSKIEAALAISRK